MNLGRYEKQALELENSGQGYRRVVLALSIAMKFISSRRLKSCSCCTESVDVLEEINEVLEGDDEIQMG